MSSLRPMRRNAFHTSSIKIDIFMLGLQSVVDFSQTSEVEFTCSFDCN